jgi:hypothetical protein
MAEVGESYIMRSFVTCVWHLARMGPRRMHKEIGEKTGRKSH